MNERIELMKDILRLHNIDMSVDSCSCCDGAWISFKYKGETILDGQNGDCQFNTSEEKEVE